MEFAKIGNDIVDFSSTEIKEKYCDQRFVSRVLTQNEIKMLEASTNPSKLFWIFWSAKEAAFKALQKKHLDLLFSPQNFSIIINSEKNENSKIMYGRLDRQQETVALRWNFPEKNVVHCLAFFPDNTASWEAIQIEIKKIILNPALSEYEQQSREARTLLLKKLESHYGKNLRLIRQEMNIRGRRKKGPPFLMHENKNLNIDLSLSHDHDWVSIAILEANAFVDRPIDANEYDRLFDRPPNCN